MYAVNVYDGQKNGSSATRPGLTTEIEVCHKELSSLQDSLGILAERLELICGPPAPTVDRPAAGAGPPAMEVAPVVMELGRMRDRITSMNAAVQVLLARVSV